MHTLHYIAFCYSVISPNVTHVNPVTMNFNVLLLQWPLQLSEVSGFDLTATHMVHCALTACYLWFYCLSLVVECRLSDISLAAAVSHLTPNQSIFTSWCIPKLSTINNFSRTFQVRKMVLFRSFEVSPTNSKYKSKNITINL